MTRTERARAAEEAVTRATQAPSRNPWLYVSIVLALALAWSCQRQGELNDGQGRLINQLDRCESRLP